MHRYPEVPDRSCISNTNTNPRRRTKAQICTIQHPIAQASTKYRASEGGPMDHYPEVPDSSRLSERPPGDWRCGHCLTANGRTDPACRFCGRDYDQAEPHLIHYVHQTQEYP